MMRKYGTGKILPGEDLKREASKDEEWTEEDAEALQQENEEADG